MATVLITGGTGLIGKALAVLLREKEYDVIILSRDAQAPEKRLSQGVTYARWDTETQFIDPEALQKADYIIHLAGAGVADKRWTASRKKEILESRTQGSALLIKGLSENKNKVKAVISASAIGWYGADPSIPNPRPFTEAAPSAPGFLGETCQQWEDSIGPVAALNIRLVKLRTGIVLSTEGGALPEFLRPVKFGIAGILGSGKQVVSWIHIDDLCRMYLEAIEKESYHGVYNAVAPKPVTNRALTLLLANEIKGRFFIPMYVPSFALRLALGGMSEEVLKSATVSCEKIRKAGFNFIYPTIESAVKSLLKTKPE